jgi:hypothetical protein
MEIGELTTKFLLSEESFLTFLEMEMSSDVFPLDVTLRANRKVLTTGHAGAKSNARSNEMLSLVLFDKMTADSASIIEHMINENITQGVVTKIGKLVKARWEAVVQQKARDRDAGKVPTKAEEETIVKILYERPLLSKIDGKVYAARTSLILMAAYPEIGGVALKDRPADYKKDIGHKVADPTQKDKTADELERGDLTPMSISAFNNMKQGDWVFVVKGYGGQFSLLSKPDLHANFGTPDFIFKPSLEQWEMGLAEQEQLTKFEASRPKG